MNENPDSMKELNKFLCQNKMTEQPNDQKVPITSVLTGSATFFKTVSWKNQWPEMARCSTVACGIVKDNLQQLERCSGMLLNLRNRDQTDAPIRVSCAKSGSLVVHSSGKELKMISAQHSSNNG